MMLIWLVATVTHFGLTDVAVRALLPDRHTLDERIFVSVLAGVATLAFVLHLTAISAGLSLPFAILILATWHAALLWPVMRLLKLGERKSVQSIGLTDRLALAVLLAVVLSWVSVAASSGDLFGADAAHYHVPYAVNIAAGDSIFDLPATPHLYPMAGSVMAAWFIVPTGSVLFVDLSMVLPFALTIASLNLLFRSLTGLSGTTWATWLGLALFSTPLFRAASAGAADLWFTAGFASALACIVSVWARGHWRTLDVYLLGCAIGLLAGAKTTGIAAGGLLLAGTACVSVLKRVLGSPQAARSRLRVGAFPAGLILFFGAGGVWLIRNWIQFGTPLAPAGLQLFGITVFDGETHQRTTYFSVLGEMQKPGFDLVERATFFISRWLGAWFIPALAVAVIFAADVVAGFSRRREDARWWARAGGLMLVLGVGAVLVWMLIGAPWTALERSGGLTLRYALPVVLLLPLLAFAALFPIRWPWVERNATVARVVLAAMAAVSSWLFLASAASADGGSALPALQIGWLVFSAVVVAGCAIPWSNSLLGRVAAAMAGLAALVFAALAIDAEQGRLRERESLKLMREEEAFAGDPSSARPWRAALLAVRSDERARRAPCAARRFFSLTRNDEPMALQPPEMTSRVYYAGRDVEPTRRAGPIGSCDYIITSPALRQTDKGRALEEALAGGAGLEPIASPGTLVVLRLSVKSVSGSEP